MVTQVTSFARNGLADWVIQRVTAVLLGFYAVFLTGFVVATPDLTYEIWRSLFSSTWMQVATLLALLSICAHGWIGMWTIITDYLRRHTAGESADLWRVLSLFGCILLTFAYLVWGTRILWGDLS
jgi:succinate dehydrogenase / fumarate reductase membrane anchor subunit